jgi:hypothetical protein
MFGTYFKTSLWVLPWFLLPVICYVFFIFGIDPYYIQIHTIASKVVYLNFPELNYRWGTFAEQSVRISLIVALAVNVLLLLIVPPAIGGADHRIKRIEFYIGFFINIGLSFCLPLYFFWTFGLDPTTFGIMIGLQAVMSLVTFIVGSRFVSPAYKRAFWFAG